MGSFLFEWPHEAQSVFVTGTFDNWSKTEELTKVDGSSHFAKLVKLPSATDKVYYKFVVDGQWTTDHTAPTENDEAGNANNVLYEKDIAAGTHGASASGLAASALSSVAPGSSTLAMAGGKPLVKDEKMPGAFPEQTPLDEGPLLLYPGDIVPDYSTYKSATYPSRKNNDNVAAQNPTEQSYGVAPIPASEGFGNPVKLAPGESVPHPSTINANTINSSVTTDKESYEKSGSSEQTFSVNPINASAGFGNPVTLAPGESVPQSSNTVNSNVTTDKESYEKSGSSLLGAGAGSGAGAAGAAAAFDLPPVTRTTIPESSLPMGNEAQALEKDSGPFIRSSGPATSTAALAGQVPLEPRGVPQVVEDSQEAANASPEASASPEAVQDKSAVENELLKKVSEQPAQSESESKGWLAGGIAAGVAVVGGAAAYAGVPQSIQDKIQSMNTSSPSTAEDVPQSVAASIKKAGADPEAAGHEEAVLEKKAMESELLKGVPKSTDAGEPAPDLTSGTTGTAAHGVPSTVSQSFAAAHASPEAAGNEAAVLEKKAAETELLKGVHKTDASGQPAPTTTAQHSLTAPGESLSATITDPTSIPSSEPNVVIADSDTLPAIAIANRDAPIEPSYESTSTPAKTTADRGLGAPTTGTTSKENALPTSTSSTSTASNPAKSAAMAAALAADKKRQDSRDVSPFSRDDGTSANPSTPTKNNTITASESNTPTSSSQADSSAKSGKRRSKLSGWFKDHLGSSKGKK